MWNWCWAKGSLIKPPYAIMFKASCLIHDHNYDNGWTEKDRLKADQWLLKYMQLDIDNLKLNVFSRTYYYWWSYIYFFAVRLFWSKYFNYK